MSKIAIVGNGNVGYHLAKELSKKHDISVFVRTPKAKNELLISSLTPVLFDFIILAIPDNAIEQVSSQVKISDTIVMHVSGFKEMSILNKHLNYGVFYGLQTFTKEKEVDFSKIPFYLEGNSDKVVAKMTALAKTLSEKINYLNSDNRKQMHIAAVFVNNFSNLMFSMADNILKEINMKFEDMSHLALETLQKAIEISPKNAQTGPAIRRDSSTINEHLEKLKDEEVRNIYKTLTAYIQKLHS